MTKLIFGADHAGKNKKNELMNILEKEFECVDIGLANNPTDDFPDFAFKTSKAVLENEGALGVLVCGTGIGMSIAANKVKGIRCALVTSGRAARLSRRDDGANVIALPSYMSSDMAADCVRLFAKTELCCEDEKYSRRVNKIIDFENGAYDEL